MLGLKHGHNILVRYDPEWRNAFTRERNCIVVALHGVAKAVEHYGGTLAQTQQDTTSSGAGFRVWDHFGANSTSFRAGARMT